MQQEIHSLNNPRRRICNLYLGLRCLSGCGPRSGRPRRSRFSPQRSEVSTKKSTHKRLLNIYFLNSMGKNKKKKKRKKNEARPWGGRRGLRRRGSWWCARRAPLGEGPRRRRQRPLDRGPDGSSPVAAADKREGMGACQGGKEL